MSPEGKKKGYDRIPGLMYTNLQKTGDEKKATEAAFTGYDIPKMEEEWIAYVLTLEKLCRKDQLESATRMLGGSVDPKDKEEK
jgi:hypothetical protein